MDPAGVEDGWLEACGCGASDAAVCVVGGDGAGASL